MQKKEKGVTLIALVVTIIVLIILAGISITTLTGDKGLIDEATNTSSEAQRESIIEKIQADLLKEKTKTGNTPTKDELKAIIEENGYNEGTLGDNNFVTKDGGYTIDYDEIIGWENNLTVEELKVGDKVNYIDKQGNIIKCIVLYDTEYNETNGTNYGIQIIASDVVCDVTLGYNDPTTIGNTNFEKAKYSYDNVISTLNKKALEYLNAEYVREARCVGTAPNNKNDEKYDIDYNQMNKVGSGIANIGKTYWMGSHDTDGAAGTTYYRVYFINSSGGLEYNSLYSVNSLAGSNVGNTYTNGFRPVFTLNSDINIINGDGVNTPYTLENKN